MQTPGQIPGLIVAPLSRDEMTTMAATLKATVLGPRFKAAAA